METVVIEPRYAGPPNMGHGGYVAGLFASRIPGSVQATLRRPIPIGTSLGLREVDADVWELADDDGVIADGRAAPLDLDVPVAPSVADARRAEAASPSRAGERGVHPTCFGCGLGNEHGLRIAAGRVEGSAGLPDQVAAVWNPADRFAGDDGTVDPLFVVAALDCAGAFAYLVDDVKAGLLGRIVYDLHSPVAVGVDHVVTGWRIEIEGKKMFAGTALTAADGTVLAAARATWFGWG